MSIGTITEAKIREIFKDEFERHYRETHHTFVIEGGCPTERHEPCEYSMTTQSAQGVSFYEGGIANMNYSISNTAEYGEYVSGKRIVDSKTKEKMKEVLKDIQSGKFTKQWMDEHKSGQKNFLKMRKDLADHPIEKVGKELRAMMPWIGKNKLVDKDKN